MPREEELPRGAEAAARSRSTVSPTRLHPPSREGSLSRGDESPMRLLAPRPRPALPPAMSLALLPYGSQQPTEDPAEFQILDAGSG